MTDKELLELAAKAAELPECGWMGPAFMYVKDNTFTDWNPLTDDGDALRLAVKLRLTIKHDDLDSGSAGIAKDQDGAPTLDGKGPWFWKEWSDDSDPYAATRRAIVRAAAEIGKTL